MLCLPIRQNRNIQKNLVARVFKITLDSAKAPIAHLKLTGGTLHAKDVIHDERGDQKADQLFMANGQSIRPVKEASAGDIVLVKGASESETWRRTRF